MKTLTIETQTAESQTAMTPQMALQLLKEGNKRFVQNERSDRNFLEQVDSTKQGQFPFATILHCIDSRVSAELLFDQGIGDVFSIRIAGNFVNEDILGSMEFASKLAGTKLVVVMGHTHCGAVKGACDHAEMGNLTAMLSKIKPVVEQVESHYEEKGSSNAALVQEVAEKNVKHAIDETRRNSEILAKMEQDGEIDIVGAMYDIETGVVSFES